MNEKTVDAATDRYHTLRPAAVLGATAYLELFAVAAPERFSIIRGYRLGDELVEVLVPFFYIFREVFARDLAV